MQTLTPTMPMLLHGRVLAQRCPMECSMSPSPAAAPAPARARGGCPMATEGHVCGSACGCAPVLLPPPLTELEALHLKAAACLLQDQAACWHLLSFLSPMCNGGSATQQRCSEPGTQRFRRLFHHQGRPLWVHSL